MSQFAKYRQYAAECYEIARMLADPHRKANMLAMAQSWISLADQADRNSQVDLVYETPSPRGQVDPTEPLPS